MLAAVAEDERARISERTKAGLRRARKQGKQLGRPSKLDKHHRALVAVLDDVDARIADGYLDAAESDTVARREAVAATGLSYNTARKYLDLLREEREVEDHL